MRKEIKIPGAGVIGIQVIAGVTSEQVEGALIKSICGFARDQTKAPDSDHYAMIPAKRMIQEGLPVDEVVRRIQTELAGDFEIHQDSDTLYIIHGEIGREKCLRAMAEQEDAIKELLAELQTSAMRIARGHHKTD